MNTIAFIKYHALGNDYLVCDEDNITFSPDVIRHICDRNRGLGSDGILVADHKGDQLGLRIFNPDGSEAEKSGNGIRIFARYLQDKKIVGNESFKLTTKGGVVECKILDDGNIRVGMGRACFVSRDIPINVPTDEALDIPIEIAGRTWKLNAVSMGNPHCVVFTKKTDAETVKLIGPVLENLPLFPNRTNVQLAEVINRVNLKIEIWERGAGYTLASGSSSSAVAAMAVKLGLCDRDVSMHMPGGIITINIGDDYAVTMIGPVARVGPMVAEKEVLAPRPLPAKAYHSNGLK